MKGREGGKLLETGQEEVDEQSLMVITRGS